jgi:type I restriction enzyme, S subunit
VPNSVRLRAVASSIRELAPGVELPYIALEHVESAVGKFLPGFEPEVKLVGADVVFRRGDVLFGKLRPYLAKALALDFDGCASSEFLVLRPTASMETRYLYYLCLSRPFVTWAEATSVGTRMPRTDWEALSAFRFEIPSTDRQRAIADSLDRETSRTDAVLAALWRMRVLLKTRMDSERDRILAPGLTGVDRRTMLPPGWVLSPLMRLTDPSRPIVYGIVQAGPEVPEGVPYIKTGDVADLDPSRLSRTSEAIDASYQRARVKPGDIVIAMRASIGLPVVVPESLPTANLTQGTARVAPRPGLNGRWLYHVLRTAFVQTQCRNRAVGTTYLTLNIWDLRRVLIPTPPSDQQDKLTKHVEHLEAQTDIAMRLRERQEELLLERKQSLITAAVTGET